MEIWLERRVDVRVELVPGAITALQDQAGVALVVAAHAQRSPKRLVQKGIAHALEQPGAVGSCAARKAADRAAPAGGCRNLVGVANVEVDIGDTLPQRRRHAI